MEEKELIGKIIKNKSYSRVLMMLIKNIQNDREEENYATALSRRYELDRGYISNRLSKMDKIILKSSKRGRRKIFRPNWDKIQELLHQNPGKALGREPNINLNKHREELRKIDIAQYKENLNLYKTNSSFKELFIGYFRRYAQSLEEKNFESCSLKELNIRFMSYWSSTLQGLEEYESLGEKLSKDEDKDYKQLNEDLNKILQKLKNGELEATRIQTQGPTEKLHIQECYKESFYTTYNSIYISPSDRIVLPKESIIENKEN
ncbi:MAG: hypothetical protein ABEJ95_05475 [Candidatus Nanohalobium sp.]